MNKIVLGKNRRALNALDLCFDMDATGSMQPWIDRVREIVTDIAQSVMNSGTRPNLRLALVEYRDHEPYSLHDRPTRASGFRDDIQRFFEDLRAVRCSGGDDAPEAVADGLLTALELPWRMQAQKAVVLIGDAPPHGAGSPYDSYSKGCPCGESPPEVARRLHERGIVLHAVAVTDDSLTISSFQALAKATGGMFATLTDARRLGDLLSSIAHEERRKVADDLAIAARFHDARGDVARLADMTGLTHEDVHRSIDRLRAKEAIAVVDAPRSGTSILPRTSRVRIVR
jgi:von Willebrand factor type A domain